MILILNNLPSLLISYRNNENEVGIAYIYLHIYMLICWSEEPKAESPVGYIIGKTQCQAGGRRRRQRGRGLV